ncbi:unnamed protein product [Cuscuta campestris]|uniref:Uncharacterized protein n=1 Tax=Cuscuta campestris TaxID=132261 RepID=A0A484MFP2_9ASTE|nr:unnamed protein product [Cuscuta campestris]
MASALIESKDFGGFLGKNYQSALDRSIQEFLDSSGDPNSEKFQSLSSNFQELLQCKLNPPLETIWFCSALDFRSSGSEETDRPSKRLASIKDLFQLIVARSLSSNSWRSIVLIAPVIYELFRFISDLNSLELKSKKQKKLLEEVKDFVGSILGYVNICSEGLAGKFDATEGLIRPVVDLVDAWMGNVGESHAGLRQFFPLLSDSSVESINAGELQLTELAGLVIAEAFLLKLCFDLKECSSRKEVESEMRSWISCSITVLRNPFFHGTLLLMLLEASLPTVASLLSSEDEVFLRELLYDAMILVDYSFLNPKQMAQLSSMCVRSISMARLMVTSEAIQMYRKNGNHKKAVSYSRAFSGSTLPSQIIKMVREEGITSEPNGSSPAALLKWILNVENSGARLFDANISKICAKLAIDEDDNNEDTKQTGEADAEEEDLFYIDTKGEEDNGSGGHDEDEEVEEMKESMSAAFLAAAQSMHSSEHKRKRTGSDAEKVKLLKKPNLCDESKTVLQKDGPESDVEGSSSSSSSSSSFSSSDDDDEDD